MVRTSLYLEGEGALPFFWEYPGDDAVPFPLKKRQEATDALSERYTLRRSTVPRPLLPAPMPTPDAARPHRVFIVDDNENVCALLAEYFGTEPDLSVCGTATSGAEALEKIPASDCDLALIDVSMGGGMSGITLVRHLRRVAPTVQCLMLSAYSGGAFLAAALSAGACGYVTKGDPDALVAEVRSVLEMATLDRLQP